MLRVVENEEYLDTSGVLEEFGASKKRFYNNIKPYLHVFHFDAKKTPWYRKQDVIALKVGKPVRRSDIVISGIFNDWSAFVRSLGFHAETQDLSVEIVTLPDDAVRDFKLSPDEKFVKRTRMSLAGGVPICIWSSCYPLSLVDDLYEGLQHGTVHDVPQMIKEKHGVSIGYARDLISTRLMSFEELNSFRVAADEPVMILRRVAYTEDKKTLIFYQDMTLLSSWFLVAHEYSVAHWN